MGARPGGVWFGAEGEQPHGRRRVPWSSVMRAGDGRRPVWLWRQDGQIHASLVPVDDALRRHLSPADVAHLLLRDPLTALPAIRAVTGIADVQRAVARLRGWWRPDRIVVDLSASDLTGRRIAEAPRKEHGGQRGRSVRTVSGGLPSQNKRRR